MKDTTLSDTRCEQCTSNSSVLYSNRHHRYLCGYHAKKYQNSEIPARTRYDKNEIIIEDKIAYIVLYNKENKAVARTTIDAKYVNKASNYKWSLKSGYAKSTRGKISLHRLIMGEDTTEIIDHFNRDRMDNRKGNLRFVSKRENNYNKTLQKNNTTGYSGVQPYKDKFSVRLRCDNKDIYLGVHQNLEDAIRARLEAEKKYYGNSAPQRHLFEEFNIA